MREAVAESERPVMLYSIGKDSSVMLHLAAQGVLPVAAAVPAAARRHDLEVPGDVRVPRQDGGRARACELLVYQNPEASSSGINPFDHGSALHTDMWKTEGLKQALDHARVRRARSAAPAATRRSRAPRSGSSRSARRSTAGTRSSSGRSCGASTTRARRPGESMRVFPLSNWTELDVWQYIHLERSRSCRCTSPAARPVVERDGTLIMVDDDRMPLEPGEEPRGCAASASARWAATR